MKTRKFITLMLALLMVLATLPMQRALAAETKYYVTEDGAGSENGSSWGNAAPATKLKEYMADTSENVVIWVAKGTYSPGNQTSDTFLLAKGVKVYGGFAGGETELSQRNWVTNVTTLNGNNTNRHVVTGGTNATTTDTRLDGFTITGGKADGSGDNENGGGMCNINSNPTVANCIFSGNKAHHSGGMSNKNSSPRVINCVFSGNTATGTGGGMYNHNYSSPRVENCTFSGNTANNGGGMSNYNASPTVVNCTFSGNTANTGGGMYSWWDSSPTLGNTILWDNTATNDNSSSDIYQNGSTLTLKNCVVERYKPVNYAAINGTPITGDPRLKALNKVGGDPATLADVYIYALQSGSSAIDAGLGVGTEIGNGVTVPATDQRGVPRPAGNNAVDIGAYEAVAAQYTTVSGDNQTYTRGSGSPLKLTVGHNINDQATFGLFRQLMMDGAPVSPDNYTTQEGSLVVWLKSAWLDTLAAGLHNLRFIFEDGEATASFTLKAKPGSFEDVAVASSSFTFTKRWQGGAEQSIDWTLYDEQNAVVHKLFNKKVVSQTEWRYNAWFDNPVKRYVIEKPVPGYGTRYQNVGVYAGITDRCCNGGTIINYKIPPTGDGANPALWAGLALLGLAGMGIMLLTGRRRKIKG